MSFISRREMEGRNEGRWVTLDRDVEVLAGKFERGTRMRIVGEGPRGLGLVDEHGNQLCETIMLGGFFTPER